MVIETYLQNLLQSSPSITSQTTQIYPLTLPQNPNLPAITWQIISAVNQTALDGTQLITRYRIQVDCWADTYGQAVTLRSAVSSSLSGYIDEPNNVSILSITSHDQYDHEGLVYIASIEFYLSA